MANNRLEGTLPESFGSLRHLKVLIVIEPQNSGRLPSEILPEYTEFEAPSRDFLAQLNDSVVRAPNSLFDLPDDPAIWTPAEVAYWIKVHGAPETACATVQELQLTGDSFLRLDDSDLEGMLGIMEAGTRAVILSGIQRAVDVVNGMQPPEYDVPE
ncbi:hypothetical protein HDU83_006602 [Entophlyctis luteolus]|nr:hypothetical protein HDU83_006602 [Entophlyctis luteolus]